MWVDVCDQHHSSLFSETNIHPFSLLLAYKLMKNIRAFYHVDDDNVDDVNVDDDNVDDCFNDGK